MNQAVETVVIGAGISGLAYAHARGKEADLIVLEASNRTGGLIRTVAVDARPGLRYEYGPEALSDATQSVRELADDLNLPLHSVGKNASKRFVVKNGCLREVPFSPPALVTTRLLSTRCKLRLATEPWRSAKKALDGSIADFVRHRLGREALETLVDPMVSGIHAGDPDQLSVRACFPQIISMIERHGSIFNAMRAQRGNAQGKDQLPGLWKPAGGMERLSEALTHRLKSRLRLGVSVRAVEIAGRGFKIRTNTGRIDAARVVLALPLRSATSLLTGALPAAGSELRSMRCESLVGIFHAYGREQVAHALDGFGYLVPQREGKRHLGTLFSSTIDPGCAPQGTVLLRTLAGGARHPELVERSDADLTSLAADEVSELLEIHGEPVWKRIVRYPETLPRLDLQHPERLARLRALLPQNLGVLGNFARGIGITSLVGAAKDLARAHSDQPALPV